MVEADATQMRQVALNLIANGAEAIGEANGTVRVRTGVEEVDAGRQAKRDWGPTRWRRGDTCIWK